MQIPWLFPDFSQYSFFSLTFNKIPWLFPDFCQVWNFPDFSLTAGHPDVCLGKIGKTSARVCFVSDPYDIIMKTHVRGFFDTDLHEVSWHFATHEAVRPSGF